MSQVGNQPGFTDMNGARPQDQPLEQDIVVEDPYAQPARPPLAPAIAAGAFAAVIAYVLWRLKLRRKPPTPSERLTEAAQKLGEASVAFGGRAASQLQDTALPAVQRAADRARPVAERAAERAVPVARSAAERAVPAARKAADRAKPAARKAADRAVPAARKAAKNASKTAVPVAERAGEVAREGLLRGAEGAGELAGKAAEAGVVALSAGKAVGATTAATAQKVGSGLAEVPDAVADAAHGVHKFWRKWTLRLLLLIAGAVGYTAGAAAGRERYDQIAGAARSLAGRPEVQRAQHKVQESVHAAMSSNGPA